MHIIFKKKTITLKLDNKAFSMSKETTGHYSH